MAAQIRTDPDLEGLLIVILTSKDSQGDKFFGLVLADANAYLTKPADPALLVDTVECLLRQSRREQ